MILESLNITKYFSFQHLSYNTGYEKPTREAFRNARQTGLRIGKGNPSYTTREPISRAEMRKKWLGWDFIHVGDDISHDWCAARKLIDMQPVWLDRTGEGLDHGETMVKFIKRSTDEYPLQMIHMAEGMKEWGEQKWADKILKRADKILKPLNTPKLKSASYPTPAELQNELRNSTITDLTELPCLFPHYHIPPQTEGGNPGSIALIDPDKWDDEVKKLGMERAMQNRATLARVSRLTYSEKRKFWAQKKDAKKSREEIKRQEIESQRISIKHIARDCERGSYSRRYSHGREEIFGVSSDRVSQPGNEEVSSDKSQRWKLDGSEKNTGRRNVEKGTQGERNREVKGESQWDWYRRQ